MHRFNKMDSQCTGAATTSKYLWSTEIYVRVHKHVTERKKKHIDPLGGKLKILKSCPPLDYWGEEGDISN